MLMSCHSITLQTGTLLKMFTFGNRDEQWVWKRIKSFFLFSFQRCSWSYVSIVHSLFKCTPAVTNLSISDAHHIAGHHLKSEFNMLTDICLNCFILFYPYFICLVFFYHYYYFNLILVWHLFSLPVISLFNWCVAHQRTILNLPVRCDAVHVSTLLCCPVTTGVRQCGISLPSICLPHFNVPL